MSAAALAEAVPLLAILFFFALSSAETVVRKVLGGDGTKSVGSFQLKKRKGK
ncbi:MAG: hypothetical protein LBL91_05080 [Lachnospiraceae bacterium]|jgi:hypothetical protein|nr:hypothetical protein [Lachnospiraceae bacterium]